MSSLEHKKISESYKDILQISNTNTGVDDTLRYIEDGEGTPTGVGVSTESVKLSASPTGDISIHGDTTVTGDLTIDGQVALSGSVIPTINAQFDLGSAEYKIRHLFLSDNSIYIGSATDINDLKTISIENGSLKLPDDTKLGDLKPFVPTTEELTGNDGEDNSSTGGIDGTAPVTISPATYSSMLYTTNPSDQTLSNQFVLADGTVVGQVKIIAAVKLTHDKIVVTPTSLADGNKIVFPGGAGSSIQEAGGSVMLLWTGANGWMVINKSTDQITLEA
jgi:hypothetical protein